MRTKQLRWVMTSLLLVLPLGCSAQTAESESTHANAAGSASTGASGTTSTSVAGSTATSGAGTGSVGGNAATGGADTTGQTPLSLPFFVNAPGNYVKSGFMGDAAVSVVAAPSDSAPDGTCAGNRASATAAGDCDTFSISPKAAGPAGMGWQGVFYQFPAGNWGNLPGRAIAAGATKVSFSARASRSVKVKFQVGLCDPENAMDPSQCADGFFAFPDDADESHTLLVDSSWAPHSVSLSGVSYANGVRGAFSWVIVDSDLEADTSDVSLFIDAITWQ